MVELFSSVPYILDNTPFISWNFIHVIKSTVYVIFVRILIVLFFHIFHIKILLSTNVTVQNKNLFYNVKSGYALNRISAPNSFKPQIIFPYIFSATLIIFNYPTIFSIFARCPPILLLKRLVKRPLAFKSEFKINIHNPFICIFQQIGIIMM